MPNRLAASLSVRDLSRVKRMLWDCVPLGPDTCRLTVRATKYAAKPASKTLVNCRAMIASNRAKSGFGFLNPAPSRGTDAIATQRSAFVLRRAGTSAQAKAAVAIASQIPIGIKASAARTASKVGKAR